MIELENVNRFFSSANTIVEAVKNISFQVKPKEFISITGPSGSGKTTLLGLLAGLDRPDKGRILIDNVDLGALNETQLSDLRREKIGFIFQNFELLPTMTALENVKIPAEIQGDTKLAQKAYSCLKAVHLDKRTQHYPNQLSGGEMQRVALARAIIHQPAIILADEPTGNLDEQNSNLVLKLLQRATKHASLILVTHNPHIAKLAQREIQLKNGKVFKIIRHHK